ncbi:MAG: hypothetical protein ACFB9M_07385 [Myxococcota bacterium]
MTWTLGLGLIASPVAEIAVEPTVLFRSLDVEGDPGGVFLPSGTAFGLGASFRVRPLRTATSTVWSSLEIRGRWVRTFSVGVEESSERVRFEDASLGVGNWSLPRLPGFGIQMGFGFQRTQFDPGSEPTVAPEFFRFGGGLGWRPYKDPHRRVEIVVQGFAVTGVRGLTTLTDQGLGPGVSGTARGAWRFGPGELSAEAYVQLAEVGPVNLTDVAASLGWSWGVY